MYEKINNKKHFYLFIKSVILYILKRKKKE